MTLQRGTPVGHEDLAKQAAILTVTAIQAAEELDALQANPEAVDVLRQLADYDDLPQILNGHTGTDPAAYVRTLADELEPFQQKPLVSEPELVERLAVVAIAVRDASRVPA